MVQSKLLKADLHGAIVTGIACFILQTYLKLAILSHVSGAH